MKKNGNTRDLISMSRWYYWLMGGGMGVLCSKHYLLQASPPSNSRLGPVIGWPSIHVIRRHRQVWLAGMLTGEWSRAGAGPSGL